MQDIHSKVWCIDPPALSVVVSVDHPKRYPSGSKGLQSIVHEHDDPAPLWLKIFPARRIEQSPFSF